MAPDPASEMSLPNEAVTVPVENARPRSRRWRGAIVSTLLGVFLFVVYNANDREIGTFDTYPSTALVLSIYRGEGLRLDHFAPLFTEGKGYAPFVKEINGHIYSRYPIAPALVSMPLVAVQIAIVKRIRHDWDHELQNEWIFGKVTGKVSAAFFVTLTGVLLYQILVRMGLGKVALLSVMAAALGSDLWTIGSQALWQHGPVALALTWAIFLLLPANPTRLRLVLAGVAATAIVAFRIVDVVFAIAIALYVAGSQRKRVRWFLPAPILGGAALIAYNVSFFGTLTGGQAELESLHATLHGTAGPWSGNPIDGFLGTLFSPNRGLFVFSPWALLAVVLAPLARHRLDAWPIVRWLLWSLVPFTIMLSKYSVWWGGHCFGPRYWTEVMPLFAILLACVLDWALPKRRWLKIVAGVLIVFSIGVQVIGAFCSPSTWNATPENVDFHHERLWDWRDTEIRRSLLEALNSQAKAKR